VQRCVRVLKRRALIRITSASQTSVPECELQRQRLKRQTLKLAETH
jgi:hypothetical protein